jgi:hypothetical protein
VPRKRDAQTGIFRMLENVVTPGRVMHSEPSSLRCPQHIFRSKGGKVPAHSVSGTSTRISSFTGILSEGMGR